MSRLRQSLSLYSPLNSSLYRLDLAPAIGRDSQGDFYLFSTRVIVPQELRTDVISPANAGLTYPAAPLRQDKVEALLQAAGSKVPGLQAQALVAVCWRTSGAGRASSVASTRMRCGTASQFRRYAPASPSRSCTRRSGMRALRRPIATSDASRRKSPRSDANADLVFPRTLVTRNAGPKARPGDTSTFGRPAGVARGALSVCEW
jgi:hypothetical protein